MQYSARSAVVEPFCWFTYARAKPILCSCSLCCNKGVIATNALESSRHGLDWFGYGWHTHRKQNMRASNAAQNLGRQAWYRHWRFGFDAACWRPTHRSVGLAQFVTTWHHVQRYFWVGSNDFSQWFVMRLLQPKLVCHGHGCRVPGFAQDVLSRDVSVTAMGSGRSGSKLAVQVRRNELHT